MRGRGEIFVRSVRFGRGIGMGGIVREGGWRRGFEEGVEEGGEREGLFVVNWVEFGLSAFIFIIHIDVLLPGFFILTCARDNHPSCSCLSSISTSGLHGVFADGTGSADSGCRSRSSCEVLLSLHVKGV